MIAIGFAQFDALAPARHVAIGFAAFDVQAVAVIAPVVTAPVVDGGGSSGKSVARQYNAVHNYYEFPLVDIDADDEEQVIVALLMKVADYELY